MFNNHFDRRVLSDPSWWQWAATVALLALHLSGQDYCLIFAMALNLVMAIYYVARIGSIKPYPVQIRLAYAVLLLLGMVPEMTWIHVVQLIGTAAMVAVGYCPLARMLNLLPWNRHESLSWRLVEHSFMRDPCRGGLVGWSSSTTGACCSLQGSKKHDCETQTCPT